MSNQPIEIIENWLFKQDDNLDYKKINDYEVIFYKNSNWGFYSTCCSWNQESNVLHVTCTVDIEYDTSNLPEAYQLLTTINSHTLTGHFELATQTSYILYRHSILLYGKDENQIDIFQSIF